MSNIQQFTKKDIVGLERLQPVFVDDVGLVVTHIELPLLTVQTDTG